MIGQGLLLAVIFITGVLAIRIRRNSERHFAEMEKRHFEFASSIQCIRCPLVNSANVKSLSSLSREATWNRTH